MEGSHEKDHKMGNEWNHNVEVDGVEGPAVCISREEVLQALNENRISH